MVGAHLVEMSIAFAKSEPISDVEIDKDSPRGGAPKAP